MLNNSNELVFHLNSHLIQAVAFFSLTAILAIWKQIAKIAGTGIGKEMTWDGLVTYAVAIALSNIVFAITHFFYKHFLLDSLVLVLSVWMLCCSFLFLQPLLELLNTHKISKYIKILLTIVGIILFIIYTDNQITIEGLNYLCAGVAALSAAIAMAVWAYRYKIFNLYFVSAIFLLIHVNFIILGLWNNKYAYLSFSILSAFYSVIVLMLLHKRFNELSKIHFDSSKPIRGFLLGTFAFSLIFVGNTFSFYAANITEAFLILQTTIFIGAIIITFDLFGLQILVTKFLETVQGEKRAALIEGIDAALFLCDINGVIEETNLEITYILKDTAENIIGKKYWEILKIEEDVALKLIPNELQTYKWEGTWEDKHGRFHWFEVSFKYLKIQNQSNKKFVITIRDSTDRYLDKQELKKAAEEDLLTGLPNRRIAIQKIRENIEYIESAKEEHNKSKLRPIFKEETDYNIKKILEDNNNNRDEKNSSEANNKIVEPLIIEPEIIENDSLDSNNKIKNGGGGNIFQRSNVNSLCFGLLTLDLDNFKRINDAQGHVAGDHVLQEISSRIMSIMDEYSSFGARFGGDEFVVISDIYTNKDLLKRNMESLFNALLNVITMPINLREREYAVGLSAGASIFPHDGKTYNELFKNADGSLYNAKKRGRGRLEFFGGNTVEDLSKQVFIESILRKSLKDQINLEIHYQPQYNLNTGKLIGAESLIRFIDKNSNFLLPASELINVAENSGLINAVGILVLDKTASFLRSIENLENFNISVNISSYQLQDKNFLTKLEEIALDKNISRCIKLELTETVLIDNIAEAREKFNYAKSLGYKISIDDFGIGYSSLNYLKMLPFDELKIDRSFIKDLPNDNWSLAIVKSIIAFAEQTYLTVVAEGIETEEQFELLKTLGCDIGQGFYFSEAINSAEFINLILKNKTLT